MNERIKDILAQPVFERLNDWVNIGPVQRATLEEFAELIVRECAKSIEKTIEVNCDTDDEKMGCEFAITDLLEHFGVEE